MLVRECHIVERAYVLVPHGFVAMDCVRLYISDKASTPKEEFRVIVGVTLAHVVCVTR